MKLASLFSHGAVLQRRMVVPVWGQAAPNAWLRGTLGTYETYTHSATTGEFRLFFPAMEAGGPYTLTITDLGSMTQITSSDIYVGEVWVASGQSNMEYRLDSRWNPCRSSLPQPYNELSDQQEAEFHQHLAQGDYRNFHFFSVPQCASGARENQIPAVWQTMTRNSSEASAVAAWFGLKLRDYLDVPIGLLISDWGGTIVEAWTSCAALGSNRATCTMLQEYQARLTQAEFYTDNTKTRFEKLLKEHFPVIPEPIATDASWAAPECDDATWTTMAVPGSWLEQHLAGYGFVWVRRTVELPANWAGENLMLNLGGIDKHDVTYFNGVEIGRTGKDYEETFWNQPRHYPIPGNLVKPGKNVIAIRIFSFAYDGSLNGGEQCYTLEAPRLHAKIALSGNWQFKSTLDWGNIEVPEEPESLKWGPNFKNTPGILFDGMIRPILNYAMRGVIWYQGESNACTVADSADYASKLTTMVRDWAAHWEQGKFPFIQVELANFRKYQALEPESAWAVLREEQNKATQMADNIFMATAVDCGDERDIHPQDKKTVGHRLAQVALRQVYGDDTIVASGPVLKNWRPTSNGAIQLEFDAAIDLKLTDAPGQAFFLAGSDRCFYPADQAEICGATLTLTSDQVSTPVAVRYAWADNPQIILYNEAKWPASPFRTDDWSPDTVSCGR